MTMTLLFILHSEVKLDGMDIKYKDNLETDSI